MQPESLEALFFLSSGLYPALHNTIMRCKHCSVLHSWLMSHLFAGWHSDLQQVREKTRAPPMSTGECLTLHSKSWRATSEVKYTEDVKHVTGFSCFSGRQLNQPKKFRQFPAQCRGSQNSHVKQSVVNIASLFNILGIYLWQLNIKNCINRGSRK